MATLARIDRTAEWYEDIRVGYAAGRDYPKEILDEVKLATSFGSWSAICEARRNLHRRSRLDLLKLKLARTKTVEQKLDLLILITLEGLL